MPKKELKSSLDDIKKEEYPAIDIDYKINSGKKTVYIYHLEVQKQVRGMGIASTILNDIESISKKYGMENIRIEMGLTSNEKLEKRKDPTVTFLQSFNFVISKIENNVVCAKKNI
jgi:GNAT superfamily N-acetyltransferase